MMKSRTTVQRIETLCWVVYNPSKSYNLTHVHVHYEPQDIMAAMCILFIKIYLHLWASSPSGVGLYKP